MRAETCSPDPYLGLSARLLRIISLLCSYVTSLTSPWSSSTEPAIRIAATSEGRRGWVCQTCLRGSRVFLHPGTRILTSQLFTAPVLITPDAPVVQHSDTASEPRRKAFLSFTQRANQRTCIGCASGRSMLLCPAVQSTALARRSVKFRTCPLC